MDGRLLVTAMDPDTIIVHRCAVDLQTGAAQELTLRYVENGHRAAGARSGPKRGYGAGPL